jgi:hypothetical protein
MLTIKNETPNYKIKGKELWNAFITEIAIVLFTATIPFILLKHFNSLDEITNLISNITNNKLIFNYAVIISLIIMISSIYYYFSNRKTIGKKLYTKKRKNPFYIALFETAYLTLSLGRALSGGTIYFIIYTIITSNFIEVKTLFILLIISLFLITSTATISLGFNHLRYSIFRMD